jgi:hypothetical protein
VPTFEAVRALVGTPQAVAIPQLRPAVLDLGIYDRLLPRKGSQASLAGRVRSPNDLQNHSDSRHTQQDAPPFHELSAPPRVVEVTRHDDRAMMLRQLNLSHSTDLFTDTALQASKANLSHEAHRYELAAQEYTVRTQVRIERHVRESRLPREKAFTTLQLARFGPVLQLQIERLRAGAFVEDAVNTVAVGWKGVGSSHVAAAPATRYAVDLDGGSGTAPFGRQAGSASYAAA